MPDFDTHIRRGHPIFMGLLLFFAIIEGCITSWLVSRFNAHNDYPSHSIRDRLRFLVFTSWWTVVFAALYLAFFLIDAGRIRWIFWLAAIASYTAALGGGKRCGVDDILYCNQLVAAEAFGWIEWILLSVFVIFLVLIGFGSIRRGDRVSGGLIA